jgi:HD-like signal output (HDOD) protein
VGDSSANPRGAVAADAPTTAIKGAFPNAEISRGLLPLADTARSARSKLAGNPDLETVRSVVESDPALAIATLKLVNSARFRRGAGIESLDQAMVRMGSDTLRTAVMELCDAGETVRDPFAKMIRDAALVSANATRIVAHLLQHHDAERAFFAALVRDVGRLLLIQSGWVDYSEVPTDFDHPGKIVVWERKLVGYDHPKLGWHALNVWGIPEPIPTVVAWHHQVGRALFVGGDIGRTVALIRAGEVVEELCALYPDELDDQTAAAAAKDQAMVHLGVNAQRLKNLWPLIKDRMSRATGG